MKNEGVIEKKRRQGQKELEAVFYRPMKMILRKLMG